MSAGELRVSRVSALPYSGPMRRPFITARRRVDAITGVIVELELDDGTIGRGSAAATVLVTGESTESIIAAVQGPIRDALTARCGSLREHAAAIAESCAANESAKAAVDVALHDSWAQRLAVPLVVALGGAADATLTTDMTISLDEPDTMAGHAVAAIAEGFQVLKIKLGNDWRGDLERLTAVARAVPTATFRLDANQGWSVKDAIAIIRRIEESGVPVQLVEQPVAKADRAGLAEVTRAVDTAIMADEAIASPTDALDLVVHRAADLFNIKLAKCGGIGQALAIADIAAAAGIECMVGAMMEPRISIAAAAHVAAAHPNITLVDLDSAEWIDDPDLVGGYTMKRSTMHLQRGPGIGFDSLGSEKEGKTR